MPYTFVPKQKHAKAYIMYPISTKSAMVVCNVVKKKPLVRAKRLLEDLHAQRRSLEGKYYSKAVEHMIEALKSCEKNAEALGHVSSSRAYHAPKKKKRKLGKSFEKDLYRSHADRKRKGSKSQRAKNKEQKRNSKSSC